MITKAEAIKILKHCGAESHCHDYNHGKHCEGCNQRVAQDMAIEALKQEPKTGRWEKEYAEYVAFGVRPYYRYCSVCSDITVFPYNYCPNCGAKMRKEE